LFAILDEAVLAPDKDGKTPGVIWGAVISARRQNRKDKAYEYSTQYLRDYGNWRWNGAIRDTLNPDNLTAEQKATLRWDDQAGYLARTQLYPAPDADLDAEMQDLWLETLAQ
jgi:hypothetical protein